MGNTIMVLVKLLLNVSLLLSLLIAPCMLLMAYWYRRQLTQTLMIWKNPEMVIVTIAFSIASLILFIVGTSSFFIHRDMMNGVTPENKEKYRLIGIMCVLLLVGFSITYAAIRMLLVRVITERGIVMNDRLFRVPDFRHVIEWRHIADYYLVSDYPNVIFTLIIQQQPLRFERVSIRVPVYMRDNFEDLLEAKMRISNARTRADISSHKLSEN
ncbi:MAG: hypothetical protein SF053_02800 [Bacteroidia bacterium]|nr:hypothetical protein [Bacteroidia bacterium]